MNTRYVEIRAHLENKIISGAWPPGHKLPSELELATEFDCARMTVSRAVGELADRGLVVRKRRAGTIVAAPRAQETVLEIHDIQAEILASGRAYKFDLLKRQAHRATDEDAKSLNVKKGTSVLSLEGVHWADDAAFALEERLINLEAVPTARDQKFTKSPPGSWLLLEVPWTEAEHQIYALAADQATARQLKIPTNAACLCIERHTWRADMSITHVRLIYPAGRHRLIARFEKHKSGR